MTKIQQNKLFNDAICGHEESLIALYKELLKRFERKPFIDATGLNNTFEDKMSLISVKFFETWRKFKPDNQANASFITWMYFIIDNHLKTVQNLSFSQKRIPEFSKIDLADCSEYSFMLGSMFEEDEQVISLYFDRIVNYARKNNFADDCIQFMRNKLSNMEANVSQISKAMNISVTLGYAYTNQIKKLIRDFFEYEANISSLKLLK